MEEGIASLELQSESCFDGEIPMTTCYKDDEIYCIINDIMDSSVGLTSSIALKRYRVIGELLYHKACELYSKISPFEANIRRHYFHVRPLDANQLQNWHNYLDFIEPQGDFDWVSFHTVFPVNLASYIFDFFVELCCLKSFISPFEIGCETLWEMLDCVCQLSWILDALCGLHGSQGRKRNCKLFFSPSDWNLFEGFFHLPVILLNFMLMVFCICLFLHEFLYCGLRNNCQRLGIL